MNSKSIAGALVVLALLTLFGCTLDEGEYSGSDTYTPPLGGDYPDPSYCDPGECMAFACKSEPSHFYQGGYSECKVMPYSDVSGLWEIFTFSIGAGPTFKEFGEWAQGDATSAIPDEDSISMQVPPPDEFEIAGSECTPAVGRPQIQDASYQDVLCTSDMECCKEAVPGMRGHCSVEDDPQKYLCFKNGEEFECDSGTAGLSDDYCYPAEELNPLMTGTICTSESAAQTFTSKCGGSYDHMAYVLGTLYHRNSYLYGETTRWCRDIQWEWHCTQKMFCDGYYPVEHYCSKGNGKCWGLENPPIYLPYNSFREDCSEDPTQNYFKIDNLWVITDAGDCEINQYQQQSQNYPLYDTNDMPGSVVAVEYYPVPSPDVKFNKYGYCEPITYFGIAAQKVKPSGSGDYEGIYGQPSRMGDNKFDNWGTDSQPTADCENICKSPPCNCGDDPIYKFSRWENRDYFYFTQQAQALLARKILPVFVTEGNWGEGNYRALVQDMGNIPARDDVQDDAVISSTGTSYTSSPFTLEPDVADYATVANLQKGGNQGAVVITVENAQQAYWVKEYCNPSDNPDDANCLTALMIPDYNSMTGSQWDNNVVQFVSNQVNSPNGQHIDMIGQRMVFNRESDIYGCNVVEVLDGKLNQADLLLEITGLPSIIIDYGGKTDPCWSEEKMTDMIIFTYENIQEFAQRGFIGLIWLERTGPYGYSGPSGSPKEWWGSSVDMYKPQRAFLSGLNDYYAGVKSTVTRKLEVNDCYCDATELSQEEAEFIEADSDTLVSEIDTPGEGITEVHCIPDPDYTQQDPSSALIWEAPIYCFPMTYEDETGDIHNFESCSDYELEDSDKPENCWLSDTQIGFNYTYVSSEEYSGGGPIRVLYPPEGDAESHPVCISSSSRYVG